ncbi:hypothetical protein J3F83DRAFT_685038 [Trichoderma novae-zelandiae]
MSLPQVPQSTATAVTALLSWALEPPRARTNRLSPAWSTCSLSPIGSLGDFCFSELQTLTSSSHHLGQTRSRCALPNLDPGIAALPCYSWTEASFVQHRHPFATTSSKALRPRPRS